MSFQEKSSIIMTGALAIVYGVYFAVVLRWLATTPVDEIVYQPLMILAIVPLVIVAVLSHIVIAVMNPKEANAHDERDRQISLRGERIGGYVLAVAVFGSLVLAMGEFPQFYIAHALLMGWVIAEITAGATRIVLYRQGA